MCQRCSFQIRIKPLERSPEPQRGWLSDLSWVLWMLCQRWTWPCNTVRPPRPTLLERRDGETYVSSVSASSPKTYIDTFHVISVRLWRPCWTEGHGKRSSFNPWCLSSQYHYQQLQLAKESPNLLRIFNISTLEALLTSFECSIWRLGWMSMTSHQQQMVSSSVDVWVLTSRIFDGQVG